MAKKVMQFRYYKNGDDEKNYPLAEGDKSAAAAVNWISGTVFGDYYPIIQLGVQGLPGTSFRLNDSITSIIIGSTGIYELDVEGYTDIRKISFDSTSLNAIEKAGAYLIVDVISDKEVVD